MKLVLIGSGSLAYQVSEILMDSEIALRKDIVSFCRHADKDKVLPFKRIYRLPSVFSYAVAVGDPKKRMLEVDYISSRQNSKGIAVSIVSLKAITTDIVYRKQCEGSIILDGAIVSPLANIGRHTLLGTGSIVEHDCNLGSFTTLGTGAVLCGGVNVGDGSIIGANATVIQKLTVGKNAVLGAGSVLTKNLEKETLAVGNPASFRRVIKKDESFL